MIFPEVYEQDKSKSLLTEDGLYDMDKFSEHEEDVIHKVLSCVNRKYKKDLKAIGLLNESYPVTYKPRYILLDILTQMYCESESDLDRLAVAIAFSEKGAIYRGDAIAHFEKAVHVIGEPINTEISSFQEASVYKKFSKIYEQEYDLEKAILCMEAASKSCVQGTEGVYESELARLKEKALKPVRKRAKRNDPAQIEFDKKVSEQATRFASYFKKE